MLKSHHADIFSHSVVVSIVSHGHGEMVCGLVKQLLACSEVRGVVVTCNIPEVLDLPDDDRVLIVSNSTPKGFSTNHKEVAPLVWTVSASS